MEILLHFGDYAKSMPVKGCCFVCLFLKDVAMSKCNKINKKYYFYFKNWNI